MVQPRNYLLLACHAANETAQVYQLGRWAGVVPEGAKGEGGGGGGELKEGGEDEKKGK